MGNFKIYGMCLGSVYYIYVYLISGLWYKGSDYLSVYMLVGLLASLPIGRSWVFPGRNLLTLVTKFGTSDK